MKKNDNLKGVREIFSEDEISLLDLIRLFTTRKKYVLISIVIFFVFGVMVAITSPIEYEAEAQILSEDGGSGQASPLGGLSGLAGLAGIQLPSGGESSGAALSPDMYPIIAASEPFLLDLMEERFYFQEKQKEMSLYEYFSDERPGHIFSKTFDFLKGIPTRFFSLFEGNKTWEIPTQESESSESVEADANTERKKPRILYITRDQRYVMSQLAPRITIEAEGRMIAVSVKMPEPYISAQLNNVVLERVIDYVSAYKTEKQRENLQFIQERSLEAEANFKEAQRRLATFRDGNQGMVTQMARTREEQLQAEFNLSFNIYNGLAQQLEQTKIQLKKDTPLFTEFEPVTVPLTKAEPSIPRILVIYTVLGAVFGVMIVFVFIVMSYFKSPATEKIYDQESELKNV